MLNCQSVFPSLCSVDGWTRHETFELFAQLGPLPTRQALIGSFIKHRPLCKRVICDEHSSTPETSSSWSCIHASAGATFRASSLAAAGGFAQKVQIPPTAVGG